MQKINNSNNNNNRDNNSNTTTTTTTTATTTITAATPQDLPMDLLGDLPMNFPGSLPMDFPGDLLIYFPGDLLKDLPVNLSHYFFGMCMRIFLENYGSSTRWICLWICLWIFLETSGWSNLKQSGHPNSNPVSASSGRPRIVKPENVMILWNLKNLTFEVCVIEWWTVTTTTIALMPVEGSIWTFIS